VVAQVRKEKGIVDRGRDPWKDHRVERRADVG
jgi:hypothetical protein